MLRRLLVIAALFAAALPAACRTTPTPERREEVSKGALMHKELKSYHLVYSAHDGKIGYLKVYAVAEAGGPAYDWSYIYDLEFNQLGFVDQFGTAYRFHAYTEQEQRIHKKPHRLERMPADSLERNVMRLLGVNPSTDEVSFPRATPGDIAYDG